MYSYPFSFMHIYIYIFIHFHCVQHDPIGFLVVLPTGLVFAAVFFSGGPTRWLRGSLAAFVLEEKRCTFSGWICHQALSDQPMGGTTREVGCYHPGPNVVKGWRCVLFLCINIYIYIYIYYIYIIIFFKGES